MRCGVGCSMPPKRRAWACCSQHHVVPSVEESVEEGVPPSDEAALLLQQQAEAVKDEEGFEQGGLASSSSENPLPGPQVGREEDDAPGAELGKAGEQRRGSAAREGESGQLQESQPAHAASMQSKVDDQAAHIERLTRELELARESPASPGVTVATRATLESQAEQIVELQRQIAEQRDAEKFLDARAATLQSKIDEHGVLMAEKQQEIDELFMEVDSRDARIYELEQAQANLVAAPQQSLAASNDNGAATAELTSLKEKFMKRL
eukprot:COSAG02_NODE_1823_length_10761_cov_32.341868_8_plen_264_part_01